jgi:hypothetical protein
LEPLEDRLLLALNAADFLISLRALSGRQTGSTGAVLQYAVSPVDARIGSMLPRMFDSYLPDHPREHAEGGPVDSRDAAPVERFEHVANEYVRMVRAEAESSVILTQHFVVSLHEPLAKSSIRPGTESFNQAGNSNGPEPITNETAPFPLHYPGNSDAALDGGAAALFTSQYEERAPVADGLSDEAPDTPSPALIATVRNMPFPAMVMPVLDALMSKLPNPQQAVDAFMARLNELDNAGADSWSSLTFGVSMAAAASAAIETVRRLHSVQDRRAALLSSGGRLPFDSPTDES